MNTQNHLLCSKQYLHYKAHLASNSLLQHASSFPQNVTNSYIKEELRSMDLKDRIKKARKEANQTQKSVADALNISSQAVTLWETGKTHPSTENLILLGKILNKSLDYFTQENTDTPGSINEEKAQYTALDLKSVLEGKKDDIDLLKRALIMMDDVLSSDPDYHYSAEDKAKAVIGVLYSALSNERRIDKSTAVAALRAVSS